MWCFVLQLSTWKKYFISLGTKQPSWVQIDWVWNYHGYETAGNHISYHKESKWSCMDHHPYDLSPCLACKQALLFDFHLAEQPLTINSYIWKLYWNPWLKEIGNFSIILLKMTNLWKRRMNTEPNVTHKVNDLFTKCFFKQHNLI